MIVTIRGIGSRAITLWLVITVAFLAVRLAPGDPTRSHDGSIPAAHAAALDRVYGLDRSMAAQYGDWLRAAAGGDLGWSFHHRRPVLAVLVPALPPTLALAGLALAFEFAAALFMALAAARSRWARRVSDLAASGMYSLPTLWLGILVLEFTRSAGLRHELHEPLAGATRLVANAILPALVLAAGGLAVVYRLTRVELATALGSGYALAARARGSSGRRILLTHALPNALLPAIQRLGLSLPALLTGSMIVEVLFSRPGLGRITHQAYLARDLPVLTAGCAAAGALVVLGSLLADLLTWALDPRSRDG